MNQALDYRVVESLRNHAAMVAEGIHEVPIDHYVDPEFYARELDTIWSRCWLWAGRASDIPDPGDYFLFRLPFLDNTSVIVVRGRDGRLRGFHNVCQHRGGRLAYYEMGSCKALNCTFHGWVFDLEGRLADVPCAEVYGELDRERLGLKPVSVDTWGGFVFVNLDPQPRWTLAEYLAPLPEGLGAFFENEPWHWVHGRKARFRCNWKMQIDAQAEGIHAPFLHGRSIMGAFDMDDVPAWAYLWSPGMPYKIEVHVPAGGEGQGMFRSRLAELTMNYRTSVYYHRDRSAADYVFGRYPGAVNTGKGERWAFDLYLLFPNTNIIVQYDHLLVMQSWPRGPGETVWNYDHYFINDPQTFGEQLAREYGLLEMRNTITEDMTTLEGLYDAYRSGAIDRLVLSEPELGVGVFEHQVRRMVEELADDEEGA